MAGKEEIINTDPFIFADPFVFEQAAEIYRKCHQSGVTPRSTIDYLIAQCAIENNLILLYSDKDFSKVVKVYPLLHGQMI